jgi:5'-deoxynucleotidase YfbR-like HD superfamily hydrolase
MYLETVTGKVVNVIEPSPDQICIDDIAWGLSRMPRFCGHTITEVPYNVAQHSVFVAQEVRNIFNDVFRGLEGYPELKPFHQEINDLHLSSTEPYATILMAALHDGSEIYTGDIPSPVKQIPELRTIVKKVEHKLMSAIYQAFNLPEPTELQEKIIKHADKIAQKIEAHAFMQSRGNHWPNMPHISLEKLQKFEAPKKALDSYHEFMNFFNQYYDKYLIELTKVES